ncbi:MAG: sugar transferase [Clostridia bacterium]|nr:sugar transferase [Clostridia bacterium]
MKDKRKIYKELGITYSFYSVFMKRFLDIVISLLGIIILSPFLILFYLLNILFMGFPGILKQPRPGANHKVFNLYKFRSMTNKRDKDGNLLPDEKRVTWYGKLIRKLSIDELPQLFNILKGDMSIVGPRPRLVKDMIFYSEDVYKFYIVRPGLTGPTQAFGRNKNTWEQVFDKDINYTHNISFKYDLKIFFYTFISLFKSPGETHSNEEEDKTQVKQQEYYYADYMKRTRKINEDQYMLGLQLASKIKKNNYVEFYPELHNKAIMKEVTKAENEE